MCGCVKSNNWCLVRRVQLEGEDGYLGADVEAHLEQVADTAADVHAPRAGEGELACGVAAVAHGQQRWREERRLALAAMRMTREDPAGESIPDRQVRRVRVVREHERGARAIDGGKHG